MDARSRSPSRGIVAPALLTGLLLGLLIGLLLGWQVWPVRWYDTDPCDLRLSHQMTYVTLVADSYALTADAQKAAARLYELTDEDTTWEQVANLVLRVAAEQERVGDAEAAARVGVLLDVAGLPSPAEEEFVVGPAPLSRNLVWSLSLILAFAALGSMIVLARRVSMWKTAVPHSGPVAQTEISQETGIDGEPSPQESRLDPESPAQEDDSRDIEEAKFPEGPENELVSLEAAAGASVSPEVGPAEEDAPYEEQDSAGAREIEEPAAAPESSEAPLAALEPEEVVVPRVVPAPDAFGVYEVEYHYGDVDFDCSFSIESEDGTFLGECGVGLAEAGFGDDAQRVEAFEIWLFDKSDIRTVSTLLVSEYIYQSPALCARLSAKGAVDLVEPGLVVRLHTLSLRVAATIRSFAYISGGPEENSAFAHLNVELVAERAEDVL